MLPDLIASCDLRRAGLEVRTRRRAGRGAARQDEDRANYGGDDVAHTPPDNVRVDRFPALDQIAQRAGNVPVGQVW